MVAIDARDADENRDVCMDLRQSEMDLNKGKIAIILIILPSFQGALTACALQKSNKAASENFSLFPW